MSDLLENLAIVSADTSSSAATSQTPSRRKTRLTRTLPTARIPFAKQLDVISAIPVAFEKRGAAVTFDDVGSLIDLSEATCMQMSGFLGDLKLIVRESGKFAPCPELVDYDRVKGFSQEKAWQKLAPVFERSWLGEELIPRLKLKPLEEADAVHALAEASCAEKAHQQQLEIGIRYLERVGLIAKEGSLLRLASPLAEPSGPEILPSPPPPTQPSRPDEIEIEGLEKHSLTLNAKEQRRVFVFAPPTLRAAELERLQKWLSFQFIIEDEPPT